MGQIHSGKKCVIQAIWISHGLCEYSIPIHDMKQHKVSSLIQKFQTYGYNNFLVENQKNIKLLTVYIPDERILLHIFQSLHIPVELNTVVGKTPEVAPSAPPIEDFLQDPTNEIGVYETHKKKWSVRGSNS